MSEWKEYTLNDFALINPTERLSKGTIAKKVAMEALQPYTKKVPTYILEEYKGGTKFKNGDTIMARITPSLENGKTSYVDILDKDEVAFGSTEYIVLRERDGVSDKHFIFYLAISPLVRETAIKSMTGSSGRQRVETDVVKNHSLLLPPLPEQKAIAGILSSLDDKIDLLHRQNQTLEAMAETLFRQWFVEEAKEAWEELKVCDIAEHVKISIHPAKQPNTIFEHYSLPAFDNGQAPELEAGSNILSNKYQVIPNSILVSKLNPRFPRIWGIDNSVSKTSICSTEFQVIRPLNPNHYAYLLSFFHSQNASSALTMAASGTSGSHQRVRPQDILDLSFKVNSVERIYEYSQIVQPSLDKIQHNKIEIKNLQSLRDTLLPKLMSGQIKININ